MDQTPDNPAPHAPAVLPYADRGTDAREEGIDRYLARRDLEDRTGTLVLFMAFPSIAGGLLCIIVLAHGITGLTLITSAIGVTPAILTIAQAVAIGKVPRSRSACVLTLVMASLALVYAVGVAVVCVIAIRLDAPPYIAIPILLLATFGIVLCVRAIIAAGRYLALGPDRR